MTIQTQSWDAADHLKTPEDIAVYLEAALEDGNLDLLAAVLDDIARSEAITHIDTTG